MADRGVTVAQAYIQIMPSTEKFGSAIKGEMSTEGQAAGGHFSSGFKKGLAVVGAATAAAAAAVGKLTKDAIAEFADYEQLVGGVNKLFGEMDYQDVVDNASQAFRTAGLSSNEYLETVTSFSASLISSLGQDTAAAVEYADTAIVDMADNANVFGTDMVLLQNAYQGFAKDNYTMLDNLKLGYGGTKTEMERLIADANRVKEANGEMANLSIDSFADVVEAIHIMQEKMNISGTTAKEASTTITGSINSMKSAWHNVLVGLADDSQDFGTLVNYLIETIVGVENAAGERVGGVINNVMPRVKVALQGISELVRTIVPEIIRYLPEMIGDLLPGMVAGIQDLIAAAIEVLPELLGMITEQAPVLIGGIVDALIGALPMLANMIPELISAGLELTTQVIQAIIQNLPQILSSLWTAITGSFKAFGSNMEGTGILLGALLVKGLSSQGLSGVKSMISSIGDMFKNGLSTGGVLGATALGITAVAVATEAVVTSWKEAYNASSPFTEGLEKITQANDTLAQSIQTTRTNYESSAEGAAANGAAAEALYGKLQTLIAGYSGTAEEQQLINGLIGEMNELVPGLGLSWDQVTGALNLTDQEIERNIELMQEQAKTVAAQELLTESLKNQYTAQNNLKDAMRSVSQAMGEYGITQEELNAALKDGYISNLEWLNITDYSILEADEAYGAWSQFNEQLGELDTSYDNLYDATQGVIDAESLLGDTITDASADTGAAIDQIDEAVNGLMASWTETFGTSMPASLQTAVESATAAGLDIPTGLVTGLDQGNISLENAVARMNALVAFDTAVEKAGLGGVEVSQSFVDSWLSGEYSLVDANNYLQGLIDFTTAISEATASGTELTAEFVNGMISEAGLSEVISAADIIGEHAKPSVVVEDIQTVGASVPKEMSASMLAAQGLTTTAAGALASNILGQFSGTPTAMNEKGSASGSQLATGLRGEVNTVKIALSKIHALFKSELSDVGQIMQGEGTIAGQKFGSAITTTTNSNIMPAIRGIMSGIRAALSALPGIMSNLGSLAGQGMYNGLASWEGAITSAAARIANSVNASTRRALQVRSPSRVMEETYAYVGEGGAIGLEKSGQQILDVAADIVQGMTDTFRDADIGMEIIGQDDNIYSMVADPYNPGDLRQPADNAASSAEIGYLMQIIAQLETIANSQWVTDTGVLVGVMAPKMNEAFAAISRKEKRR